MAARAIAAGLLLLLLAGAAGAAGAAGEDVEDPIGGFEDEAGSGDETRPDDLGGFDDEEAVPERPAPGSHPLRGESWELTGSLGLAGSVNLLPHRSVAGDTDYQGLSKLRSRLNLQLDLELPWEWELRAAGFAYYDWAYRIRGRSDYTSGVLRKYEWDADTQDFWLRGTPIERFDVKLGRQVVSWGRSESLRVLDVLNPLDNREPGIADIEDLRRAVTMGRFDYYLGDWNLSLVAIPEIRFHQNPPPGSDFNPTPDPILAPPPAPPVPLEIVERKPDSLEHWEAGVALTGIFEGWDVSFHGAYFYDDQAVLQSTAPLMLGEPGILQHNRLWLVGSGGNYTLGSWLLKGEIAFVDGLGFTDASNRSRLDVMAGVEYYGFTDTTVSLEALNRHVFDFPATPSVGSVASVAQEDATSGAIRVTRSFFRERLDATLVAVLISGDDDVGSVVRIDAAYDLREAVVLTAGFVLYQESDLPPLSTYGDNDRFFFELKYSF